MALVWILMVGCGGPEMPDAGLGSDRGVDASVGPVCDGGLDAGLLARGLSRVCSRGIVASGFAVRLGSAAQPISRLGAYFRTEAPDGCERGAVLSRATLVTEVDPRADGGIALATYHVLSEPPVAPPPSDGGTPWAGARVARGTVSVDIDSAISSSSTVPVLIDLLSVGLDGAPEVVVVLDGYEIDTDVSQATGYPMGHRAVDGYPLRSVGAAVSAVIREGADLRFEATATLAFGRTGEGVADRAAAMARASMVIHYAVVGLPTAPPSARISYRSDCRPGASITAFSLDGPVGARAAPALTAFAFDVRPGSEEGTSVRELSVLIDGFTHDSSSGRADMDVIGFLEGPNDAVLETQFDADVVLLGWTGADAVVSLRYASAVAPGRVETSLPLTP